MLVTSSFAIFAGDVARKGTTGADQLLIPVGARGIALGGSFVSHVRGIEAIYYNPAGLDLGQKSEAMFNYMTYLADINISYFAANATLGDFGSIGLSFKTMDFGDIPITTVDNPDGEGAGTYSPGFLIAGLTFSKIITDRVAIGFNAKMISETISEVSALGFALDFGVHYKFNESLQLGATVMNIGTNMEYSGIGLQHATEIPNSGLQGGSGLFEVVPESFQIPSYFELSIAYTLQFDEQNEMLFGTRFRNNNVLEDQMSYGLEYGFMNTLFLRGGYDMFLENLSENIYGFTFGAGIQYEISKNMNFGFDYAYRDVKEFADPNHVFTVILGLM
jgi:opacity protein-like surface antigen